MGARSHLVVLAVLAFCLVIAAPASAKDMERARVAKKEAEKAIVAKTWCEAGRWLLRVHTHSDNAKAIYNAGVAFEKGKHHRLAFEAFEQFAELAPLSPHRADALERANRLEGRIEKYGDGKACPELPPEPEPEPVAEAAPTEGTGTGETSGEGTDAGAAPATESAETIAAREALEADKARAATLLAEAEKAKAEAAKALAEAERARAEAERVKAEAAKLEASQAQAAVADAARAEYEKALAEADAEKARAEAEKARAEADQAQAEMEKARVEAGKDTSEAVATHPDTVPEETPLPGPDAVSDGMPPTTTGEPAETVATGPAATDAADAPVTDPAPTDPTTPTGPDTATDETVEMGPQDPSAGEGPAEVVAALPPTDTEGPPDPGPTATTDAPPGDDPGLAVTLPPDDSSLAAALPPEDPHLDPTPVPEPAPGSPALTALGWTGLLLGAVALGSGGAFALSSQKNARVLAGHASASPAVIFDSDLANAEAAMVRDGRFAALGLSAGSVLLTTGLVFVLVGAP